MEVFLIFLIIIIAFSFFIIKDKITELQKQQINLSDNIKEKEKLDKEISSLVKTKERLNQDVISLNSSVSSLSLEKTALFKEIMEEKNKINQIYEKEKHSVNDKIEVFKTNANFAMEKYIEELEKQILIIEKSFDKKNQLAKEEFQNIQDELQKVKSSLNAATEAQLREREKKEKIDFYKLSLSKDELNDIQLLESIKPRLKQPRALCMLIWSSYFQKQTTDLCNRLLNLKNPCGVYKITNILTNQVYIGQSVKIADRWKEHIKCGLGIDTPVTNKLYKAMLQDGVYNFTFELLEECSKDKLNEIERFWIEMHQSDKVGYNVTKGNK